MILIRKRKVRAHLADKEFSIEGILMGMQAGHYRLANASHLESEGRTHSLEGEVWIPRDRIVYLQIIG